MDTSTQTKTFKERLLAYLKALPQRYFITAFSGMAQGLFVSLIAGTILAQIAGWIGDWIGKEHYIASTLLYIANIAKALMGSVLSPISPLF